MNAPSTLTRPVWARFLTTMVLLGSLLASPALRADTLYRPPNMEKEIFDPKKIELDKFDRAGLVAALVALARDFTEEDEIDFELRAHALAIAGRLDPDSEKYSSTCEQLVEQGRTIAEDNPDKSRTVSRIYSGARVLARKDNSDNKKCAAYCVDIALRADPNGSRDEALQELRETLKSEKITADWSGMLGEAVAPPEDGGWWGGDDRSSFEEREETMPGGKASTFKSKQSSVFGLVVVTLGNGKHAGSASSIIATALRDEASEGLTFQLNQKVGPMMANSLESIVNFLRVTYEDTDLVPKGYKIDIVFEDKDQPVDGPSAGTAMALMLEALFTGETLDEGFACTGGITPNGKVTSIGGVAAKIRGATRRNCQIVGVPEGNANGVADNIVLQGIEQLLSIQIFGMKDIEEARAISREVKSPEVQETLDAFDAVAGVIKEKPDMIKNVAVQEKLEEVLKKMPNHLSAKFLLEVAKGNSPTHLSVGGSFQEIDSNASGVFSATQMMAWREKYDHGAQVVETAKDAVKTLSELDDKVDERMEEYLASTIKLSKLVLAGKDEDSEEIFLQRLEAAWEDVQTKRQKLLDDPALREEIMG